MEDVDAPADGARWARDDGVVWCGSVDGLGAAVAAGHRDVELHAQLGAGDFAKLHALVAEISTLSLTNCGLDAAKLSLVAELAATAQLKGLGVSANPGIGADAWKALFARLPPTLEKADFGDNQLEDEVLPALCALLERLEAPCELFVDGNKLADVRQLLLAARACPELDLGDNALSEASVQAIAAALDGAAIEVLVLGSNPGVTGAAVLPLVYALPKSRVRVLYLDNTGFDNAALEQLADVLADTALEELHVDRTRITDPGVMALLRAVPGSQLGALDISGNDVSPEAIAAIEQALGQEQPIEEEEEDATP